ncbi:hypothetical protein D3C74_271950 [compost metagenome]
MASRIQFRITDDEYAIITQNATQAGYSSISQYVKDLALSPSNTVSNQNHLSFNEIYKAVEEAIEDKVKAVKKAIEDNVDPESIQYKFVLRDITPGWGNIPQHTNTPRGIIPKPLRASVGKHFYNEVKVGKFQHIRCTGKTAGYGTMIYEVFLK